MNSIRLSMRYKDSSFQSFPEKISAFFGDQIQFPTNYNRVSLQSLLCIE